MTHDLRNPDAFQLVKKTTFEVVKGAGIKGRSSKEEADALREKIDRSMVGMEPGDGMKVPKKYGSTARRHCESKMPNSTFKIKQIKEDRESVLLIWVKPV